MQKNDIVRVEYDVWVKDSEQLFDTTHEDLAKEHGIYDEHTPYKPLPLIVGVNRVPKGFDEAMLKAEVGKESEIEIGPSEAYGERDLTKIKTHSMHEFRKQDVMPEYGKQVTISNKVGTIVGITAGRVRVDFNHPLAGKTLKYKFKIVEHVEKPEDKIGAAIEMNYLGAKPEDFKIKVEGNAASIQVPDTCKYDQRWFMAKYRIVNDLQESVGIDNVNLIEHYERMEDKKATADKEESAAKEVKPIEKPIDFTASEKSRQTKKAEEERGS
jgi:FKBP-type peptidyl-prolyl cis-trans isomerase 2